MPTSSPAARRSRQYSSPGSERLSPFLSESRNTEVYHFEAIAAAQAEHERVREAAILVYQTHELQEQNRKLQEQQERVRQEQRREEERIRNEEQLRAEEERLRALRAQTVPRLSPEEPPSQPASARSAAATTTTASGPSSAPKQVTASAAAPTATQPQINGFSSANPTRSPPAQPSPSQQPPAANPFASLAAPQSTASPPANPFEKPVALQQNGLSSASKPAQTAVTPLPKSSATPSTDRYVQIHQNLKKLRASLLEQAKLSPPLKQRLGNMRRELRKNLGQLVGEKGGNRRQVCSGPPGVQTQDEIELTSLQIATIQALLNESLTQVPSALIDPSDFITDKREPVEGATHNEPQLPSLFIYLLNQFSKAIINQFIQECGGQPKTADPIGVVTAMIFSNKAYLWRGKTLIDVLMAKFRVVCPVLFGYRGSEKTEQGRTRLGWKREGGAGWIPEQLHINRMKGLGVGYASISLRDFSKSPNTNPWPPAKYWVSVARIVNTPPAEVSNTQCVVLRSMIELYEERFMNFYGTAAIAAMRKALVELPAQAQEKSPGVLGLSGLADVLKLNVGLEL